MKKILLFVLFSHGLLFGQTKLNSHFLELKRSKDFHQILTAKHAITEQVFVFAADKENTTVLKYNAYLFFRDSLITKNPESNNLLMSGYSFDKNQNPIIYWQSENFKKITAISYNFETKTTSEIKYQIDFKAEELLLHFTENNIFYLLSSLHKENKLKLYVFKENKLTEKIVDFSSVSFLNQKNKPASVNEILDQFPITKIAVNEFNSLLSGTQKTKLYIEKNQLLFTFDHNVSETQIVTVDLNTFEIKGKKIAQSVLKSSTYSSNSYFSKDKLFQIKNNDKELNFEIKDFNTGSRLQFFSISEKDSIGFKSSPVFVQTGNQRPRQLTTTKKVLRNLAFSAVGLTVYKTNNENLITIGSTKFVNSTGTILLGTTIAIASVLANGEFFDADYFDGQTLETTYFESYLDQKLQPSIHNESVLAIDKISFFMDQNKAASLETILRFKNFYILAYYDAKAKEYVMRKFSDGNRN